MRSSIETSPDYHSRAFTDAPADMGQYHLCERVVQRSTRNRRC
jgi:hypothetical protein